MASQNQDIKKNRISILKSKKVSQIIAKKTAYRLSLKSTDLGYVSTSKTLIWDGKNKLSFEGQNLYSLSPRFADVKLDSKLSSVTPPQSRLKKAFQKSTVINYISCINKVDADKPTLSVDTLEETSNAWVLNKVHPHHYSNILGYRKKNIVVNPNITLQGIRRVLHYLKTVIQVTSLQLPTKPVTQVAELIVVVESSMLSDTTNENAQASTAALVSHSLLRLQDFSKLKVSVKTSKETVSYLASTRSALKKTSKGDLDVVDSSVTESSVCGVLILNPAKSVLGSLADTLFNQTNKKDKKVSAGNAIGTLCAKKGIPLISLCDVSSPVSLCTYPIVCDTRNLKSVYLVLDLLTYGLNRLKV